MPRRGTTYQRGYGHRHRRLRERWQTKIDRGAIACWRCGNPIPPNDPDAWDLGHDDTDRTVYRGPECRRCNRSAGAQAANQARWHSKPTPAGPDREPQSRRW